MFRPLFERREVAIVFGPLTVRRDAAIVFCLLTVRREVSEQIRVWHTENLPQITEGGRLQ